VSITLKIAKATQGMHSESLCTHCRWAQIVRGVRMNDELQLCHYAGTRIAMTSPVTFCSDYDDKRTPPLHEMEKIAWRIVSDRKTAAGFLSPKEWKAAGNDD